MDYHIGETAIIDASFSSAPSAIPTITITDDVNGVEVIDEDMSGSGTSYSYDYQTSAVTEPAEFRAVVTAIDGTRIVIEEIIFNLIKAGH